MDRSCLRGSQQESETSEHDKTSSKSSLICSGDSEVKKLGNKIRFYPKINSEKPKSFEQTAEKTENLLLADDTEMDGSYTGLYENKTVEIEQTFCKKAKSHQVVEKLDSLEHGILGKRRRDDKETGLQDLTEEF